MSGPIAGARGTSTCARTPSSFLTNLPFRDLADHAPINYVFPLQAATPAG